MKDQEKINKLISKGKLLHEKGVLISDSRFEAWTTEVSVFLADKFGNNSDQYLIFYSRINSLKDRLGEKSYNVIPKREIETTILELEAYLEDCNEEERGHNAFGFE